MICNRMILGVCLAVSSAVAGPSQAYEFPEEQYRAGCTITIEGKDILDGICPVQIKYSAADEMGVTYLVNVGRLDPGDDWAGADWVQVDVLDENETIAFWNGGGGSSRAHYELGKLDHDGGDCWFSEQTRICILDRELIGAVAYDAEPATTAFRGVALGMSRPDIDHALWLLDMRCVTTEELVEIGKESFAAMAAKAAANQCFIVQSEFDIAGADEKALGLMSLSFFVLKNYQTFVTFADGKAAFLSLAPEFFAAAEMTGPQFARSIADNYRVALDPVAGGWVGRTGTNELVRVFENQAGFAHSVSIEYAGPPPAFN